MLGVRATFVIMLKIEGKQQQQQQQHVSTTLCPKLGTFVPSLGHDFARVQLRGFSTLEKTDCMPLDIVVATCDAAARASIASRFTP